MAGFKSVRVAGFKSEDLAGFVGIRILKLLSASMTTRMRMPFISSTPQHADGYA